MTRLRPGLPNRAQHQAQTLASLDGDISVPKSRVGLTAAAPMLWKPRSHRSCPPTFYTLLYEGSYRGQRRARTERRFTTIPRLRTTDTELTVRPNGERSGP